MAFQLSPGVNVSEIDLTTVVPAVATTEGAIAGVFRWGPTNEAILIGSEVDLVNRFGKPYANTTWSNAETFFTAANFLSYSDALYVVRTEESAVKAAGSVYEAAYEGELGNSLQVATITATGYAGTGNLPGTLDITASSVSGTISASGNTSSVAADAIGDLQAGDSVTLTDGQELTVTSIGTSSANSTVISVPVTFGNKYIGTAAYSSTVTSKNGYTDLFDNAPSSASHYHVVVIDADGEFTGVAGTVLERYENVTTNTNEKKYDGSTNFIDQVLENNSAYIRRTSTSMPSDGAWTYENFTLGDDGEGEATISIGDVAIGYDLFKASENIDVSLILTGKPNVTLANYVIDNIAESRKDAIAFVTPNVTGAYSAQDVVDAVATLSASSYAVVDSGLKYQYDKYNDLYRWIPLNGDVAGLCARTDDARDPWFSPAGYSRGSIKNVVKLGLNPTKTQRDLLYNNGINPVITQAGQGTLLFGDKTFLNQPSAFDRINVRRLFIVLEKAIAIAAKSTLFEFNDEFTRAQFRNLVEPYLRDVQGRRGIYDFRVVCDETNNTGQVIDSNQFVGDIYIKPARAINFIQLNFIAVRTGVEFSEIVGQ
jgi:phage tail sheath protein FI